MRASYWAVRPINMPDKAKLVRIERAETAAQAAELAFGRGLGPKADPIFEAKNLGSRVSVLHSHRQRVTLLTDPNGWVPITD